MVKPDFFLIALFIVLLTVPNSIDAQSRPEPSESFWAAKSVAQREFDKAIRAIQSKLFDVDPETTVRLDRQLLTKRDPRRTYIFLPPENKLAADRFNNLKPELKRPLIRAIEKHANKLFEIASREAQTGNATWALQTFNEVLFYWPDHEKTRQVLGHRLIGEDEKQWRVKPDRLKIRRRATDNKRFNWPEKTYWLATTESFQIASRASEEQTKELARNLERWKDVWRQIFFEYYNTSKNLNRWIEGSSKPAKSRRKFDVYFFGDRNQYVETLKSEIPGIEASTGYYSDTKRESYFFYDDDPHIRDTWKHEMTHQLFQESIRTIVGPFDHEFLWLGEGIAMYFESMVDHGDYFTVGGFDARRLQYARMRRLKEQYRVSLEELSSMSRDEFQSLPEIAKVYSQSAGVTHYLMNGGRTNQSQLAAFFKLIYTGKLKRGQFLELHGESASFNSIEYNYHQFLTPPNILFFDSAANHRELALINQKIGLDELKPLIPNDKFDWIDLSACDLRKARLKPLVSLKCIGQLFLTGCILDSESVKILADIPVTELDLSGSSLTNEQLAMLGKSKSIQTLNVAGTKVTISGLKTLATSRADIKLLSNIENSDN